MTDADRRRRRRRPRPPKAPAPQPTASASPAAAAAPTASAAPAASTPPAAPAPPTAPTPPTASTSPVADPEGVRVESPAVRRKQREAPAERGLRDLIGAGQSVLGVSGALRGRDVNRPTDEDLAEAERDVVIVRRHWKPPAES